MTREEMQQEFKALGRKFMLTQQTMDWALEQGTPKQIEFVVALLSEEVRIREERRRKTLLRRAHFPTHKTLGTYEWGQVRFPAGVNIETLQSLEFIGRKENLLLYGPVGTGKTHLAIALGVMACEQGLEVRFATVADMALRMSEAHRSGTLDRFLKDIRRTELLILDEWGYLPLDRESAQLLFRLVADSYEQRSLILTTNLEFARWGSIFTDEQMTAAMIDRIMHHGYIITTEGESYRLKHALMNRTR